MSLALLCAAACSAPAQNFLLGVHYSELIEPASSPPAYSGPTATDSAGNLYTIADNASGQYLIKLAPNGETIYQNLLQFPVNLMTVDPQGDIYLSANNQLGNPIEKLDTDGSTVIYKLNLTFAPYGVVAMAADRTGRLYLTGSTPAGSLKTTPGAFQQTATGEPGFVIRLTATGAVDYATYLGNGTNPAAIAVDNSGTAFITGYTSSPDFPITPGAYLSTPQTYGTNPSFVTRLNDTVQNYAQNISIHPEGDASVAALENVSVPSYVIMRFNPQGTAIFFSKNLPAYSLNGLAVDSAGNTYVAAFAESGYPQKNSLTTCSTAALTVFDVAGNVLQSTYLPGMQEVGSLAVGNFYVDIVSLPSSGYVPAQESGGSANGGILLTQLSFNHSAKIVPLVCVGNAGSFDGSAISPGEIVSLFGNGLGPAIGVEPQVTLTSGFPTELSNVKVTFNGTPGPIFYVQDNQINAIAPWSLPPGDTAQICVTYNTTTTNCISLPIAQTHPGILTVDGIHAAALNQDGSINSASNPAKEGSIVSVFGTGFGPIDPAQPDGPIVGFPLPSNVFPVTMFYRVIGAFGISFPLTVTYAGPAPFEVAGVTQINVLFESTVPDTTNAIATANQVNSQDVLIYLAP